MTVQSANTYNISGRVIDNDTQQGMPDLRIEAWDAKLEFNDAIESAFTDDEGNFKIVITEIRLQECSIGLRDWLFFKVFQQDELLAGTENSVQWSVANAAAYMLIEVSPNGSGGTYKVFGQIREQDGDYFPNGIVRAFDKDMRTEQLLGQALTDSQGQYEIYYQAEQFSKDERKSADLIVRVYNSTSQLQVASPVIFNAASQQRVNLVIGGKPYRGPSEYERFVRRIIPVSQGVDFADLTQDDVAFLRGETEIKSKYIAFLVVAARHSKKTGIAPEPFYGMFRKNLPTSLPALFSQSREAQRHALQSAINENIIPFIYDEKLSEIINQLRQMAVFFAIQKSDDEAYASLGDILDTVHLDKDLQAEFLTTYSNYEGNFDGFWAYLLDHPTLKTYANDLQFTMQISTLTRNHLPLITYIQDMRHIGDIKSLKDLTRLDVEDWKVILDKQNVNSIIGFPPGLPGQDDDEKATNYAKTMKSMLEDAFPTAAVAARLEKDDLTTLNKQDLTSFFSNNPEFDFGSTHIDSYLAENAEAMDGVADKAVATSQLKAMQRVFKLTTDYSEMSLLLGNGLGSAQSIAYMSKNTFLFKYGDQLSSQQAKNIYEGAAQASAVSMNLLASFGAMFNDISMYVLPSYNPPQLNGVPDLETLFGSLDLCECEHCSSIYSPAAYLVDILHFLGGRPVIDHITGNNVVFKQKTSLLTGQLVDKVALDVLLAPHRRPDLAGIALTCENTNTALPYVDLVNEILEEAVHPFALDINVSFTSDLNNSTLSSALKQLFANNLSPLSDEASVQVVSASHVWLITDIGWTYTLRKGASKITTLRVPQTSRTAEELSIESEHVNGDAYNQLSNQVYPGSLPFSLWIEEARGFLDHLGVPRHELMKTFQKTGASPAPSDVEIACEHLRLNSTERKLITLPGVNPVWKAWEYWGYPVASPGNWTVELRAIPEFLRRSRLSYDELLELLKTRLINPNGSIKIESNDPLSPTTCDLEKLRFNNLLTLQDLALMHRFVRLWRKLGWSMRELDSVIDVMQGSISDKYLRMNEDFLVKLSRIETLRNKLKLPIEQLLTLWSNIEIKGENSLYQRLFLNPLVLKPVDTAFELDGAELAIFVSNPNDAKISNHTPTILSALEITAPDLELLITSVLADDSLNLANLSKLYRVTILARALKISINDTLTLIALTGIAPFDKAHIEDTLKFVEVVKKIYASGFGIEELDYLLRHSPEAAEAVAPTEQSQALILDDLRSGLQKIIKETTVVADQNGSVTQKKLSLLKWDAPLVEEAIATLAGNVVYEASLSQLPPAIVFPESVINKVAYDEASLKLSFAGSMTNDEKSALLGASAVQAYQNAVTALYNAPRGFVTQKMKAFQMPTFSASLDPLPQGIVFPDELKSKIYYDAPAHELRFAGAMTGAEKAALLSLSSVNDYQAAINTLFNAPSGYIPDAENSFLSAADSAQLFDQQISAEDRFELVLTKLLAHLRVTLNQELVKQKLGEALKLKATVIEQLLTEWVSSPTNSGQKSIEEFLTPDFAQSDSQVKLTAAGFPDQFKTFTRLQKVATVISKLKITAAQLRWVFEYAADAGWLDLNSVPVESGQPLAFAKWERMIDLFLLRDRLPQGETTLSNIFGLARNASTLPDILAALSEDTGWSLDDLTLLTGASCFNYSTGNVFKNEQALNRLRACFTMMNRLGVSAEQCLAWAEADLEAADARNIKQAARLKYEEDQWLTVAKPLRDVLREKQRAALVDYLAARPNPAKEWNWKDANGLYDHFLIDIEMSPCQMTSRIKQALSSVQLFVQRSLMRLETEVGANTQVDSKWLDWKWMKNYRVWEANRKVFLYPENWIEPDLRDEKTPFFKELENELLQNDVTMETAEAAFLSYLEKLDSVARLEICGMFHQIETDQPNGKGNVVVDVLHVFGRTRSTPHVYYYRRRVDDSYWTAWERVDLDIEGNHLIPVVWNRRLHLFWPVFKEETEKKKITVPAPDTEMDQPLRYLKIQIAWSELKSGKWSAKKVSEEFIRTQGFETLEPIDTKSITFKGLPQESELIIRCYAQLVVPLEKGLVEIPQIMMLQKEPKDGDDPGGSDPGDNLPEDLPEDKKDDKGNTPSYEEPPLLTTVTAALGEFRFTGCFGKIVLRKQNQLGNVPYLAAPTGSAVENMGFVEYVNGGTSDDKLHLLQLEAYSPSTTDDIVTLKKTPGTFRLLPPHQYEQFASQGPFFFQDNNRTFFVVPFYERVFAEWSGPDIIIPEITFDYYYAEYYFTDPAGPVINPGDGVQFEPSFSLDSKFRTYKPMNLLSEIYSVSVAAGSKAVAPKSAMMRGIGGFPIGETTGMYDPLPTAVTDMLDYVITGYYTPMYPTYVEQLKYRFEMFYHPYVCLFVKQLNRDGIDGLLQRRIQTEPESFLSPPVSFDFDSVYKPKPVVAEPYPEADVDFSHSGAYSQYNWELFFHSPLLIADRLSKNQRFEEAQRWFHYIFDPTDTSSHPVPQRYWRTGQFFYTTSEQYQNEQIENLLTLLASGLADTELVNQVQQWRKHPFNPHLIARLRTTAYQKNVVMKYIDNLISWGDQLFRRDTIESINEATQLYILAAEILGERPASISPRATPKVQTYSSLEPKLDDFSSALVQIENIVPAPSPDSVVIPEGAPPATIPTMMHFCVPKNDKLLGYWDTVADRLFKIRHCMNIEGVVRQLPLFEPPIDPALLVKAVAAGVDIGSVLFATNAPLPQYRFNAIAQKATDLCSNLQSLGSALLSAMEKRDAEAMSLLRSTHEIKVLSAARQVREKQIEEAKHALDGLKKTKDMVGIRHDYYAGIAFMNQSEKAHLDKISLSIIMQAAQGMLDLTANTLFLIPNVKIGAPTTGGATFGGENVGAALKAYSAYLGSMVSSINQSGSMNSTMGSYQRRSDDWKLQQQLAAKELEQLDKQITAAEVRLAITERELQNHDLQIENSKQADEFMRDKFTNRELYDWMMSQISGVYFQSYQLAYDVAKRAERAYRFELGLEDSDFIMFGYWDSLKKGLLAGERLMHDIKRMEVAYLDKNKREYEMVKNISLALLDAIALIKLRETGECFVDLDESVFDMDYQGHYFRRIKSISLTIPCVAGPYTGVNCTLTLMQSSVRKNAIAQSNYFRTGSEDNRFIDSAGAIQSIATSSAQNDSGLFELNFHDERYLPFEGAGAISRWRIQLPKETNHFNFNSISDVILHLKYTARDGGETLKQAAKLAADLAVPKSGVRAFSIKHEFSVDWNKFLHPPDQQTDQTLTINVNNDRFPFQFREKIFQVKKLEILLKLKHDSDATAYASGQKALKVYLIPPKESALVLTDKDVSLASDGTLNKLAHSQKSYTAAKELGLWSILVKEGDILGVEALNKDVPVDNLTHHRLNAEAIEDLWLVFHYIV
jgi:hypothetical protein